jgi:hypothetical protein
MAIVIEWVKTNSKYALWKLIQLGLLEVKALKLTKSKLKLVKKRYANNNTKIIGS